MLNNFQKKHINGTHKELQLIINEALKSKKNTIELEGVWEISESVNIISQKNRARFKILGKNAKLINNVSDGNMITFKSDFHTIWDDVTIDGFEIITTKYPKNSNCIVIEGGCFGGGIYNCNIGGFDGENLLNGTGIMFVSNHEDFGLVKNFEISNCKLFFLKDYGIFTSSKNSTPAYITIRKSDIEMCFKGGIVGSYENLVIEQNIIAYNGKDTNLGGVFLHGLNSYVRNIVIRDNGFEHNCSQHIQLDRITNCNISNNTMVGLLDGTNNINNDRGLCLLGEYGILCLDFKNNRIESIKSNYIGIEANNKVRVMCDNLNQFVFCNSIPRKYSLDIKVFGIKEDGSIF